MNLYKKQLEIAKSLIKEAGQIILDFNKKERFKFKEDNTIVTNLDINIEELLYRRLCYLFPDYGFVGEESHKRFKEFTWIVDPLDGTAAFIKGLPEYGIGIALMHRTEVILSVVYFPFSNELIWATKNGGMFLNDKKIRISSIHTIQNAYLSLGGEIVFSKELSRKFINLATKCMAFKIGGSSLRESYYLASGKTDILIKHNQKIWDTAPEYLILKEAGAGIVDLSGKNLSFTNDINSTYSFIATNSYLFSQLEGFG